MRLLFMVVLALLVSACASKPITEYIYITEVVELEVSPALKVSCKPNEPIGREAYSQLSLEKREVYLSNYAISLMGSLKKCDNQKESILKQIQVQNQYAKDTESNMEKLNGDVRKRTDQKTRQ